MLTATLNKNIENSESNLPIESLSKSQLFSFLDDLQMQQNKLHQKIEYVKQVLDLKVYHRSNPSNLLLEIGDHNSVILDENNMEFYKQKLVYAMEKDCLYLNADLNLGMLSTVLQLPLNKVSKLINQGFHQNFSEFVNSYRLNAFLNKVNEKKAYKLTILGLAYNCGFNSKTVFNTYFKRKMGITPKEYLKNNDLVLS